MKSLTPKRCEVKAHSRQMPPSPLFNATSLMLMRETGYVPDLVKATLPKPRERVKAGRKAS